MTLEVPSQKKLNNTIEDIPVEYFKWGTYPDHFKIEMPHQHQFAELLFFTKGGGSHEIDFNKHTILPESIHYIPRSVSHFIQRDTASDGFTLAFNTDYFEKNNIHKFLNPLKHESFALQLSKEKFQIIIEQTNQILYQIKQHKSYYREKCFLLSIELLLHTLATVQIEDIDQDPKISTLVRNFKHLVNTNYHQNHIVAWYANELNISSKHLGNQVKKELTVPAKEYILRVILKSVKKQLLNTDKSFKQIAFEHQYDPSALGKLFKSNVGHTMKEYKSYKD